MQGPRTSPSSAPLDCPVAKVANVQHRATRAMQTPTDNPPETPCARNSHQSVHDLTFTELEAHLIADGVNRSHCRALWKALYRGNPPRLAETSEFSPPLRRWIESHFGPGGSLRLEAHNLQDEFLSSDGLTRKFLLRLADGQAIESVAMGYPGRFTACVSTQAGCAMGCVFCATGQMGFSRHLRPGEIVAQVLHVRDTLRRSGSDLRNLVLMGMGEPLHNYDAVMTALDIVSDTRGINIGPARITISTVGVVPGILRMADEKRNYRLAVSLHGSTDADRTALVPIGARWPLNELMAACLTYNQRTGQRIFFEWTLIEGRNDSTAHATQLASVLAGIDSHVNLIPLNPTNGYTGDASPANAAREFQRTLTSHGIPSTVRQRRGIDVAAGCGQLRTLRERSRQPA